jgi:hypothetical protein
MYSSELQGFMRCACCNNTAGVVDAASRGCDRGAGSGTAVCGWDWRTRQEGHTSAAWKRLEPANFQPQTQRSRCAASPATVLLNWKLACMVPCCDASADPYWL